MIHAAIQGPDTSRAMETTFGAFQTSLRVHPEGAPGSDAFASADRGAEGRTSASIDVAGRALALAPALVSPMTGSLLLGGALSEFACGSDGTEEVCNSRKMLAHSDDDDAVRPNERLLQQVVGEAPAVRMPLWPDHAASVCKLAGWTGASSSLP